MTGYRGAVLARFALLAALAAAGGCASGGSTGRSTDDVLVVEVRNDLVPGRGVTVRLVSQSDTRLILGSVSPGRSHIFRVRRPGLRGEYHLTADPDGGAMVSGQTIVSSTVVLSPGSTTVQWRLATNFLTVTDASDRAIQRP